ncbi:hypothetical protein GWC95_10385 [Sediminibacterium roseum]|uniref:Uncharacterized protein n=1 Tax=Sediminibacterium roseum TaxID=1978412 RepID=A0ABW9ZZB4_9BACT|nr:hypothetical protein [Sediminibacterium roseum]NCI50330.1 hypothetical protein [Sediminibacterium roseum]
MSNENKVKSIRVFLKKGHTKPESLPVKVLEFLKSLRDIDAQLFSTWFEQGQSKKQALSKEVRFEERYIAELITKEWDDKFPELGSTFMLWSGKDSEVKNTKVSFRIGVTSSKSHATEFIGISMPFEVSLQPEKDDRRIIDIVKLIKQLFPVESIDIYSFSAGYTSQS